MMSIHINGREITSREINIESAHHQEPGADPRYAWRRAAVALAVRELLVQRARAIGITVPDEPEALDAALDALIEQEVPTPEASEADCRRWYDSNPEQFRSPDVIEARHILLAAAPDDLDMRDTARDLAEALIDQLRQAPNAFPALAAQHSRCASAESGGHLGQIGKGQTVPEFEDVVLRAGEGLLGRPVETRYGFHVVEVLHRSAGVALPFESVRERIAGYLHAVAFRRALNQYIRLLAGEAELSGIDLDASESALIQ